PNAGCPGGGADGAWPYAGWPGCCPGWPNAGWPGGADGAGAEGAEPKEGAPGCGFCCPNPPPAGGGAGWRCGVGRPAGAPAAGVGERGPRSPGAAPGLRGAW